jgi:hypothetical protein
VTTAIDDVDDGWLAADSALPQPFEVDGIAYNPTAAVYLGEAVDRPAIVELRADDSYCYCAEWDMQPWWTCSGDAMRWLPDMPPLRFGDKPDGGGDRG